MVAPQSNYISMMMPVAISDGVLNNLVKVFFVCFYDGTSHGLQKKSLLSLTGPAFHLSTWDLPFHGSQEGSLGLGLSAIHINLEMLPKQIDRKDTTNSFEKNVIVLY